MIIEIINAAKVVGISSSLLMGICQTETGLKNVIHYNDGHSHSYGICQIKHNTAKRFRAKITKKDLLNAYINAVMAAEYLKYQLARYNNNQNMAISAYNAGHAIKSNKKYVRSVLKNIESYSQGFLAWIEFNDFIKTINP